MIRVAEERGLFGSNAPPPPAARRKRPDASTTPRRRIGGNILLKVGTKGKISQCVEVITVRKIITYLSSKLMVYPQVERVAAPTYASLSRSMRRGSAPAWLETELPASPRRVCSRHARRQAAAAAVSAAACTCDARHRLVGSTSGVIIAWSHSFPSHM